MLRANPGCRGGVTDKYGSYERMASLDDGPSRMTGLAEQVRLMWVQQNPARTLHKDAPEPAEGDDSEWAERRVSVSVERRPSKSFRACLCKG